MLHEAFKFFDKAGKGKITPEDLVNGFTALGNKLTLADAKDIVNIIGGGDSINLDEFKEIAQVMAILWYILMIFSSGLLWRNKSKCIDADNLFTQFTQTHI